MKCQNITNSDAHIRENIDIFDFEIDDDDMASIEAIDRNERLIDPDWAPQWDT